jgi:valyl-tRNA synthetase
MSETAAEPANAAKTTAAGCEIFVTGLLDTAADATRLARERADLEKKVKTLRGRLDNKGYLDKAPPHLVKQTQDELAAAEAELATLEQHRNHAQSRAGPHDSLPKPGRHAAPVWRLGNAPDGGPALGR